MQTVSPRGHTHTHTLPYMRLSRSVGRSRRCSERYHAASCARRSIGAMRAGGRDRCRKHIAKWREHVARTRIAWQRKRTVWPASSMRPDEQHHHGGMHIVCFRARRIARFECGSDCAPEACQSAAAAMSTRSPLAVYRRPLLRHAMKRPARQLNLLLLLAASCRDGRNALASPRSRPARQPDWLLLLACDLRHSSAA